MCGIIGYTGKKLCAEKLIKGLYALEYRGYDSAGMATFEEGDVRVVRSKGGIDDFVKKTEENGKTFSAVCGIAHTRWATHGEPSDINAHPHRVGRVTLVHNGIIENYKELKEELVLSGYSFSSETDTEVAAALIDSFYRDIRSPEAAICSALKKIRGSYAFGILFDDIENEIYGARKDSPLLIGIGEGETYLSSDITAFLPYTKKYVMVDDGEIVHLRADGFSVLDMTLNAVEKDILVSSLDINSAEKGGYDHFMLKEIHEEKSAVERTLGPRVKGGLPDFSSEISDAERLKKLSSVHIVACGTAMHAGLYAKYMMEKFLRIPVFVDTASEFRYSDPILDENTAVFAVSQSGETADTLAAIRLAKERGVYTLGIVNVLASAIAREADDVIYTYAGPEISVASTKAYTVQTSLFGLFTLWLSYIRGKMREDDVRKYTKVFSSELPEKIEEAISREESIKCAASALCKNEDIFFIGRSVDSYIATESALKLKEISYIHAESYSAGELKHGTISLINDGTPVITLLTRRDIAEKTISNMREVISRGARVYLICAKGVSASEAEITFELPDADELVLPIVAATVTQLFAYHAAVMRNCSVDKPRNLAKSVTVE